MGSPACAQVARGTWRVAACPRLQWAVALLRLAVWGAGKGVRATWRSVDARAVIHVGDRRRFGAPSLTWSAYAAFYLRPSWPGISMLVEDKVTRVFETPQELPAVAGAGFVC